MLNPKIYSTKINRYNHPNKPTQNVFNSILFEDDEKKIRSITENIGIAKEG